MRKPTKTAALFKQAIKNERAEKKRTDALKAPAFRAGNSGCQIGANYVGECKRKTILRYLGIDAEEIDDTRELMFQAGRGNEDHWVDVLKNYGVDEENIRCEEKAPIKWSLSTGDWVTGRPDVVLGEFGETTDFTLEPTWTPTYGYELKLVSSLWTGKSVLVEGEPKDKHVVQAAHYYWQLGTPKFELLYLSRADFAIGKTYHGMFSKVLDEGRNLYRRFFDVSDQDYLKKMTPFLVSYDLNWEKDGALSYRQVTMDGIEGPLVKTLVTREGIRAYYEDVSLSLRGRSLPPRPSGIKVTGSKAPYKDCQYCPLKQVCDKVEKQGFEPWLAAVKEWTGQNAQHAALEEEHRIK